MRKGTGFARRVGSVAALAATLLAASAHPALADPFAATMQATYTATPPAIVAAGGTAQIPVTVANAGTDVWPASGITPVNLSYHWYDVTGQVVVWDGVRTAIGQDILPTLTKTVTANVAVPPLPGMYTLRFALVKEGVGWFAPGPAHPMQAVLAYQARFGAITPPLFVATSSLIVGVPVTNTGLSVWNATGANPVSLSYHWHDTSGSTVVWDGARTPLAADVAPNGTATVQAKVTAPSVAGTYRLTFDLVREGVAWFGALGATPATALEAQVQPVVYNAAYAVTPLAAIYGENKNVAVTLTNTGNILWPASGASPVSLGAHLWDAAGNTVFWDYARVPLGSDLAPGQSKQVVVPITAPSARGTFTLGIEAVREGVAWFGTLGAPAARVPFTVTSGYSAGYGITTTPPQATIGATLQLQVQLTNYGVKPWPAGGASPVHASYHITSAGVPVVWDGIRSDLPQDVKPGETVNASVSVALPQATGDYVVSWDLVQEGFAWFSQLGIQTKDEPVTVVPGVTFYGKGFGHGVGLSQYGAQGWATGAVGSPLTGEQIVAKYYPGTTLLPVDLVRGPIRVLLSPPSSSGGAACGPNTYMSTPLANLISPGGFRVLNEGSTPQNAVVGVGFGNVTWQVVARNGVLQVWNNGNLPPTKVYDGPGPIVLVPVDSTQPITLQEKNAWFRGNLKFTNLGGLLRVVNYVSYDDYVRGVIPREMPLGWHIEAYKAQAYAARTYAYSGYQAGARDYDVRDDQSDQCYGGASVETTAGNAAVAATAGKVITYNGAAIRAYFASSSGGYTKGVGCWNPSAQGPTGLLCAANDPYLVPVADPADLAVRSPDLNKHANWTVSFTSGQIRNAILNYKGIDIGTLRAVDITNQVPAGIGHVVSLRVQGTGATVVLSADVFLRTYLGLKSTMVRLSPF